MAGPTSGTPVRLAATVMLVRDPGAIEGSAPVGEAAGLEVFLLHRVGSMAFAAGMTVFPGGGVDDRDHAGLGWSGPDPEFWADRFAITGQSAKVRETARAVVVAAIREVFEETGVLLADVADDAAGADRSRRDELRVAVSERRAGMADVLGNGAVRSDLLRPWGRWVTPEGESRRYDTFFFVAALPHDQHAELLTTEAEAAEWLAPAEALEQARRGERAMLPPTVAMLTDLAGHRSVQHLMAAEPDIEVLHPRIVSATGERVRVRVGDREYPALP